MTRTIALLAAAGAALLLLSGCLIGTVHHPGGGRSSVVWVPGRFTAVTYSRGFAPRCGCGPVVRCGRWIAAH